MFFPFFVVIVWIGMSGVLLHVGGRWGVDDVVEVALVICGSQRSVALWKSGVGQKWICEVLCEGSIGFGHGEVAECAC